MVLKIGITGNIASGKSQLERFFLKKGYPVYDTDKIAHEILDGINDFYGYDVFTEGKIDRKKLSAIVFENPDAMKKLESIVHPKVRLKICDIFAEHADDKLIFISVPQLYESGFEDLFDKVVLIISDDKLRYDRLKIRNNLNDQECMKRMQAQMPQEKKAQMADYIISNNTSLENLYEEAEVFLNTLI